MDNLLFQKSRQEAVVSVSGSQEGMESHGWINSGPHSSSSSPAGSSGRFESIIKGYSRTLCQIMEAGKCAPHTQTPPQSATGQVPAFHLAGFFSPYIIVPKKSGGLRPILGLRILNWAFHKPPFKMLTQKCIFGCIRPRDRSAAVDLKDPYFHVSIFFRATGQSCCLRSKDVHISTRSCP